MKKRFSFSIPTKIIFVISVILILIMSSTTAITNTITYNNLLSSNKETMSIITSELYDNFENMAQLQMNDVSKMALDQELINLSKARNSTDRLNFLNKYVDEIKAANIKLGHYSTDINIDEQIFVTDKSGVVIADSNSDYLNYDSSNNAYTLNALKGNSGMSSVYFSTITSKLVITFVEPLKDKNGDILGTVGKSVYIDYFSKKFDQFKFLKSGFIFIVDNNKNVIYHPNKYDINKKVNVPFIQNLVSQKDVFNNKTSNSFNYSDKNGNKFEAYYITIPQFKSVLVLAVNGKDIKDNAATIGNIVTLAAIIMLLIIIPVSYIFIKRVLSPLKFLSSEAIAVSKGNLMIKKRNYNHDEIGTLADSFNYMITNIKDILVNAKKVSNELYKINDFIKSSQKSSASSMGIMISHSSSLVKDTDILDEVVKLNYQSLLNINSKIDSIANQSIEMIARAKRIKEVNENGIKSIENLKQTNIKSKNKLENVNSSFNDLTFSLGNIKSIVDIVRAITKQTRLLALNASIEASRTGMDGEGFKIIADQIKKLSNNSTIEISNIEVVVGKINKTMLVAKEDIIEINKISSLQEEAVDATIQDYQNINDAAGTILYSIKNIDTSIESLKNDNGDIVKSLSELQHISADFISTTNDINKIVENQSIGTSNMDKLVLKLETGIKNLNENMNRFKTED